MVFQILICLGLSRLPWRLSVVSTALAHALYFAIFACAQAGIFSSAQQGQTCIWYRFAFYEEGLGSLAKHVGAAFSDFVTADRAKSALLWAQLIADLRQAFTKG